MGSVQQIEFRWQQHADFGPIASSTTDPRLLSRYRRMFVSMAEPPKGVVEGHRSVVYLVFPEDDLAVVIERSYDRHALIVGTGMAAEDGGRHQQVSRALVGPREVVSLDLALACGEVRLADVLEADPPPGRVPPGHVLAGISPGALEEFARAGKERADQRQRRVPGLPALIAAVLRDPAKPISVLLPAECLHGPGAAQGDYLRGLRSTIGCLLPDLGCGWLPSFSTFEPPAGGVTGNLPHLLFRDVSAHGGTPPTQLREEHTLSPLDGVEPAYQDDCDWMAQCLAGAYAQAGAAAVEGVLGSITRRHDSLRERLEAIARHHDLSRYGASASRSRPETVPRPSPPVCRHAEGRAATPREPGRNDQWLIDLYLELDDQRGHDGFFEIVEWICAAAARDVTVAEDDAEALITRFSRRHWYVTELREHYRDQASARLAGLLHPLFGGRLGDVRLLTRLGGLLAQPAVPPTMARAITSLYARLDDQDAALAMEEHLAPALLLRARAARREANPGGRPAGRLAPVAAPPVWQRTVPVPMWALAAATLFVVTLLMVWR